MTKCDACPALACSAWLVRHTMYGNFYKEEIWFRCLGHEWYAVALSKNDSDIIKIPLEEALVKTILNG